MCYNGFVRSARFFPALVSHARPFTQSLDGPRGPSNSPFRWQSSFVVVPPYRYVAPTYLLCFSLLRKHRGWGVFFPFWYKTIDGGDANSLHYSSSFFSHSCALFCAFLHFKRTQLSSFQSFPHSSPKNTPRGVPLFHYYPASHFSGVGWPVLSGLYIIYFLTSLPRSLLTSLHLCFITSSSPVQSLRFQPGEK